jgi:hypothetical protein
MKKYKFTLASIFSLFQYLIPPVPGGCFNEESYKKLCCWKLNKFGIYVKYLIMKMVIDLNYDQVLSLVKQLPYEDKKRLAAELKKDIAENSNTQEEEDMEISFNKIEVGKEYSRPKLAELWGYKGYQALAKGVVTPKGTNKIILFVTKEKQSFQEQYQNQLIGQVLHWEGPTDHFGEDRMVDANNSDDEILVFYRIKHHSDFTYLGIVEVDRYVLHTAQPSKFVFQVK